MSKFSEWLNARTTVLDHAGVRHDFEEDEPAEDKAPLDGRSSRLRTIGIICLCLVLLASGLYFIYDRAKLLAGWLGISVAGGFGAAIAIWLAFGWFSRRYPGARDDREERADRDVEVRLAKGRCGVCAFQLPAAPQPEGPFVRCSECGASWRPAPVPAANPESTPMS